MNSERVAWVDYAKGICIIMVVMMHSTLGVEKYAQDIGWMHHFVEFARPFRMPDFFLISGLFLAQVIDRDWPRYLDRKVVHYAYFYVLWTLIQLSVKSSGTFAAAGVPGVAWDVFQTLWAPLGTLWFLYMLGLFFIVAKLCRRWPLALWLAAAALHLVHREIHGLIEPVYEQAYMIEEFANRFVFFLTGWLLAPQIFAMAARAGAKFEQGLAAVLIWLAGNGLLVYSGYADWTPVSLALGLIGAMGIVTIASLVSARDSAPFLRFCGQNSIVIYLAFFLPMAATRTILLKYHVINDLGWISLIVTTVAVLTPLALHWLVLKSGYGHFLFERPAWAYVAGKPKPRPSLGAHMAPAE